MTREIGDILIQQTVDSDYEIERKVRIIEKIEKLVMASLNMAATITEMKANQEAKKEEAKEMIQNGASVRETQEATGLSYRQTAKISQELHKQENMQKYNVSQEVAEKVTKVQEAIKAEKENLMPTRPTRPAKVTDNIADNKPITPGDNTSDNTSDNITTEEPTSLAIAAKEVQKPDMRTYEEKAEGMKNFSDPSDPDGKKAEFLIQKAKEILGIDEYAIMCNAYNKPETYQRLCNLWDYFNRNKPEDWPPRPEIYN